MRACVDEGLPSGDEIPPENCFPGSDIDKINNLYIGGAKVDPVMSDYEKPVPRFGFPNDGAKFDTTTESFRMGDANSDIGVNAKVYLGKLF